MDNTPPIDAEKLLASVAEEHSFRLKNGGAISSLRQLYSALQSMEETVFSHHVSGERHDFGNWVKDVHKDYRLANSLFSAADRTECARAVGSRVYELEKMLEGQSNSVVVAPAEKEVASEPLKLLEAPVIEPPARAPEESPRNGGFNREVEIAKAILERKPINHLLEPRKRAESKKPAAAPPPAPAEKSELETAAERLEKILSDAAKAKIDDDRKRKFERESVSAPPADGPSLSGPDSKEESIVCEDEPLFHIGISDRGDTDDLIKLIEEKSFASQLKSDMLSLFSRSSVKTFTDDMKSLAPAVKRAGKPVSADVSGNDKDRIIAHLKKVYK
ncbi:hypothetical protein KY363_06560 [Candidatus Woesearchaeota archaeon]|nr:hypothetical protein [Candidatus Woesearchaeota archaeon]